MHKALGRRPKLDDKAEQALIKKVEKGAIAAGFPSEQ
jgi:hypothetical protein